MIRATGSMPATGTAAMETVATEIAAEREAFLEIFLADLKPAIDKVISNLKCRALQARHFFVIEAEIKTRQQITVSRHWIAGTGRLGCVHVNAAISRINIEVVAARTVCLRVGV